MTGDRCGHCGVPVSVKDAGICPSCHLPFVGVDQGSLTNFHRADLSLLQQERIALALGAVLAIPVGVLYWRVNHTIIETIVVMLIGGGAAAWLINRAIDFGRTAYDASRRTKKSQSRNEKALRAPH